MVEVILKRDVLVEVIKLNSNKLARLTIVIYRNNKCEDNINCKLKYDTNENCAFIVWK